MEYRFSKRIETFGETVFAEYSHLAGQFDAVNLGQGFPDFDPPSFVTETLRDASSGYQQYAPLSGMPALNKAVAAKMSGALGRELDPVHNVQITDGATEALFAAVQALIDQGDEVILLEPFYDAYPADVIMAGGVPKYVPLHPQADGNWHLDIDELRAAFNNQTKAIILNTPHNPTGKVFMTEELDAIIKLAEEYDALIISDEVYEHIAFEPHVHIAGRPGGWERTFTVSSLGKTFSVTGWKIGWVVGPEALIHALRMAHQWIPFAVATPLQRAAARVLSEAAQGDYYAELTNLYQNKRDLLLEALQATVLEPLKPQGGYFVMANTSALDFEDDVALCRALPERVGVSAIPPSAFYSQEHKDLAKNLVRLAYCKSDEAILEGGKRLQQLG